MLSIVRKIVDRIGRNNRSQEEVQLMLGRVLSNQIQSSPVGRLRDAEFKVFSQWGDDGIIQWLTKTVGFPNRTFVEFGVESYQESNTRFLMMNNNWSGLIIDGSPENIAKVKASEYYWKFRLDAKSAFVDRNNINSLLGSSRVCADEVGILHIDIDGNDYWIWEAIECVSASLVIVEYNSVFGPERAITVPYDDHFNRTSKHYSNLYFGASLRALCHLARKKGYRFIGSNGAGNNAYFLRSDLLTPSIPVADPAEEYVASHFRESRNSAGELTFLDFQDRVDLIRGLPVVNVVTGETEPF